MNIRKTIFRLLTKRLINPAKAVIIPTKPNKMHRSLNVTRCKDYCDLRSINPLKNGKYRIWFFRIGVMMFNDNFRNRKTFPIGKHGNVAVQLAVNIYALNNMFAAAFNPQLKS